MTAAVIDLGTNTFHLLIAEIQQEQIHIVHRKRSFVKLGLNGKGPIEESTLQRAFNTLNEFRSILNRFPVEYLRIIGTAAMRTAPNAYIISDFILKTFQVEVEIIDGLKEAQLIYKGITHKGYPSNPGLIMDIGGGSVEFIFFEKEKIQALHSLNIGIGWLWKAFDTSDPITKDETTEVENFLNNELASLIKDLERFTPNVLIGSSGTFDLIFNKMIGEQTSIICRLELVKFIEPYIHSTRDQRTLNPAIPASRVDYVPIAFILLRTVLNLDHAPDQIQYSPYSLKEGVLSDFLG
jgi:exopolyphosphatase/guanosine-5'-triphosphate,3'-diphosphate pyrophosphatase